MKKFAVDTLAMVTFSFTVGMAIELLSGYTFTESLSIRLVGTVVNILLGGLYGLYLDWVRKKIPTTANEKKKKIAVDVIAFVTFQIPQYILVQIGGTAVHLSLDVGISEMLILLSDHIDVSKIAASCLMVTLISSFIGGPYGWFLDHVRRLFGVVTKKKE